VGFKAMVCLLAGRLQELGELILRLINYIYYFPGNMYICYAMWIAGSVPYELQSCGIFFAISSHLSPLYPAEAHLPTILPLFRR
jgi:hypothetical protein